MKFICPRCGGDAFHLHKLPDNDSMAQCIACGKAIVFEQATATASALTANAVTDAVEPAAAVTANAVGPEASGQSDSAKRGKLHLPNRI